MVDAALLFSGLYGVALGVLILSWFINPRIILLFVGDKYNLGYHGQMWANWHAIGCLFVGGVNLLAFNWGVGFTDAKRSICLISIFVYGVWAVQNLLLVLDKGKTNSFMWLHVTFCAIAAVLSLMGYLHLS